jgi:hypothetical protein
MSTVQRIYQRSDLLDARRRAMDAWENWVTPLIQSNQGSVTE